MSPKKKPGQKTGRWGDKKCWTAYFYHPHSTRKDRNYQPSFPKRDIFALIGQAYYQDRPEVVTALCGLLEQKRGDK